MNEMVRWSHGSGNAGLRRNARLAQAGQIAIPLIVSTLLCAGLVSGQSRSDPALVLARARDKVLDLADRLPRYTCVQTVDRTYFRPTKEPHRSASCDQFAADRKEGRMKLKMEATDRLRLDVTVARGREIHSWAGASRFDSRDVDEIVGGGPIGTGPFGTFLLDIFRNDGANFEFQGVTQFRGEDAFEYAYQVPFGASHYLTHSADRTWRVTSYSGSVRINPASGELQHLTVLTSELPPETGTCTADTQVEYERVRLGTGDFLLPLKTELEFLRRDGTLSHNATTYSKCREYQAESNLSFEEPRQGFKPAVTISDNPLAIFEGLQVVLALLTPIDTDTAAAGDAISARVQHPVLDSRSHGVSIPEGAAVRGRIVRSEHRLVPSPHFLISISWATIEIDKMVVPFFARIDESVPYEQVGPRAQKLRTRIPIWLPPAGESQRAGGWFIFPTAKSRYLVPAGYETRWVTATRPAAPVERQP